MNCLECFAIGFHLKLAVSHVYNVLPQAKCKATQTSFFSLDEMGPKHF